ncbi:MAG: GspH/FimT family pseudopilin [Deltaproteobacteria bacterium]|nr:GspH/FimT family pseudopilin [Deltaproteobacteria bacterium]
MDDPTTWMDHSRQGFSVVELLTVLTIFVVLATLALSAFVKWLPDLELGKAVRGIKADMQLTKSLAIRKATPLALEFSVLANNYTIFTDNGVGGGTPGNCLQDGSEPTLKVVSLPAQVTIAAVNFDGTDRFGFGSRGLPYDSSGGPLDSGRIELRNTLNHSKTIQVDVVGRITIP